MNIQVSSFYLIIRHTHFLILKKLTGIATVIDISTVKLIFFLRVGSSTFLDIGYSVVH